MQFGLYGNLQINVKTQKIDSLALSANKFYGPKGVGALYVRKGIKFRKLLTGGSEERNKRAGTENIPGIVGMGKAIEIAYSDFEKNIDTMIRLRNYCIKELEKLIKDIKINGDRNRRLPGNISISINNIDIEKLLLELSNKGICISNGNTYNPFEPSHVLLALNVPYELAKGSLEISIGKNNTKEEIDYLLENLVEAVETIRKNSSKNAVTTCKLAGKCSGNCAGCNK